MSDIDRARPSALIVGAQKAATSAMLRNLRLHPKVWGHPSELHFFTANWERGEDWYLKTIRAGMPPEVVQRDGLVVIEKSPSYLANEAAAERIAQFDPDMKIIICLRNPVDRAFSRWNDIRVDRPDGDIKPFSKAANPEREKISHLLRLGIYAPQVARYIETFGRDRIKVVIQERWASKPQETLDDVWRFLGLDPVPLEEVKRVHSNPYVKKIGPKFRKKLEEFFRPHNAALYELLGCEVPEWEARDTKASGN